MRGTRARMASEQATGRRNRAQWRRLVAAWRRSGRPAAAFAASNGVVEGTLRWWAWRLGRDAVVASETVGAGVELLPVRIVECDGGQAESTDSLQLAWKLHTPRGELSVYASSDLDLAHLRATVAALLGEAK